MVTGGKPPKLDDLVWYRENADRYAACQPGNQYGCGEIIWYFSGGQMEDFSEIVVCSANPNQQGSSLTVMPASR